MHQALGPLGHQAWRRSPQATTAQSEARAHEAGGGNAEEEEDHAARGRGGAAGAVGSSVRSPRPIADSTANTALQGEISADDGGSGEGLRVIGA